MPQTRPVLPDATNAEFLLQALREVNERRAAHHVPPLAMDPLLVEYARARAAALSGGAGHEDGRAGTGENVFHGAGADMSTAADAVAAWYAESAAHDWNDPRPSPFSALVWKATTAMGAARVAGQGAAGHETWIVFVFEPPGNVAGEFQENVPRP
ncbi:CAP domain-containing protein [Nonomuraea candida]|uniref:CAP domain-containing protein n=1 Tax=Nonomuraea candida TaxID=359159 RepID=UPI000694652F|nr:CAP domain-containing protein [Nonomuraea candida]